MTAHSQHNTVCVVPIDSVKTQVIGYNGCRLGLAAEKHVVPRACLHLHRDMTTRDGGNMAHEEWRDVVGYEGLYQVSNLGRVRSLDRRITDKNGIIRLYKGKMLSPHLGKIGYYVVNLRGKVRYVHRLVAEAFLPTPSKEQTHVDHIDGNKTNNHVSNLRFCTSGDNIRYASELGLVDLDAARKRGGYAHARKSYRMPVIRSDGKRFSSIREAAKAIGRTEGTLSKIIRKGGKSAGYSFRLDEEALERS